MATGTKTDLIIYNDEFFSGIVEVLEQYAEDVSSGTNGAVNFVTQRSKGDFEKRSFWDVTNLIRDRDPTSTADAPVEGMSQGELVAPKSNLGIGPVENTEDSFYKISESPQIMSLILGQQMGPAIAIDWLNRGMAAASAVLTKTTDTHLDISDEEAEEDAVLSPKAMNRVLGKMSDRRGRVVAWVMHGQAYTQLTEDYLVNKIDGITDLLVMGAASPSLGLPVLISDSPALIDEVDGKFTVLGLTEDAVRIMESEEQRIFLDRVSGKENLVARLQGEYSLSTRIKGNSWSGGTSPDVAALGNSANWNYVFNDIKSGPGVALTVKDKYFVPPTA